MGVVYEAEQISLRRRVALKVLPFAAAIDPRRLQRFKTEALTAAQVQHERIVPVYAVGCERGVHYYAMQFIEGQSLAALIGELRRLRDEPAPAHPGDGIGRPGGRADLPRASALESAARPRSRRRRSLANGRRTAAGISTGRPGWAGRRRWPWSTPTRRGSCIATSSRATCCWTSAGSSGSPTSAWPRSPAIPGSRSPENSWARSATPAPSRSWPVEGSSTTGATSIRWARRSTNLLTLRPPFEGRDRNALIRQIAEDEPPAPSALDRSVPAELETIVLKALRKDPADRYGTAQELAEDLRRFLDGRPILARRPTLAERLRAWSRRHPSIVGAGSRGAGPALGGVPGQHRPRPPRAGEDPGSSSGRRNRRTIASVSARRRPRLGSAWPAARSTS